MENLDNDVLENILSRLPLGTASSKAKRVCESWKTILDNRPHNEVGFLFACHYVKNNYKEVDIQLYFGEEYDRIDGNTMNKYYSHETLMEMEHCRIHHKSVGDILVGSCNGLVCLRKSDDPFAVCNPLTGEFVFLKANLSRVLDETIRVSSGFGYCHSTKEYKVVRIYYTLNGEKLRRSHVQVYTIGSNEWRDIDFETDLGDNEHGHTFVLPGIFANGFIHWLENDAYAEVGCYITVFDLEDEKFQPLPMPPSEVLKQPYSRDDLNTLGGNLCWVHLQYDSYKSDIWAYKRNNHNTRNRYAREEYDHKRDYYSENSWSWVKEFSMESDLTPFAITKSNDLLLLGNKNFYYCDPKTQIISKLGDDDGMDDCSFILAIPHANSNVSLKGFGETWYGTGCSAVPQTNSYVSLAEDKDVSLGSSTV